MISSSRARARGFVLSFAVLILSLFLLIFAQIHSTHLSQVRGYELSTWQKTVPLRLANDFKADLNTILDEHIFVDHNATQAHLIVSSTLPSPLSLQANLLRYQTALSSLGRDFNTIAFLDLNATTTDGNITGRLNNGFEWKRNFSTSTAIFRSTKNTIMPKELDLNIYSSLPYIATSPWTLDASGNIYITLTYHDQNTAHVITDSGWITSTDVTSKQYTWTYGSGETGLSVRVGQLNRVRGSMYIDNNNTSALTIDYSLHAIHDQNSVLYERAGYDLPLSVVGTDGNVIQATQWVAE